MHKKFNWSVGVAAIFTLAAFVVFVPQAMAVVPPEGDIAVEGIVKMPDGTPASGQNGVGVNLRSEDFSTNIGTGVDENGYYAIPVESTDEWNPGTVQVGTTYFLEVWTGNIEGVVPPDPVPVVYSGSTITKNLTLVAAKKTINVSVQYDGTDDPVTTANVWANKRNGGGGAGGDVDANGEASFSVSGGQWEVNINCGWNHETNSQQDCDWTYNEPPKMIEFSNDGSVESENLVFDVKKTNAKIKGTVYLSDGTTTLQGGWIDVRSGGGGGGMGTGIDWQNGTYTANVVAGDYAIMAFPDNMNAELTRYYSDEVKVRVGENETKTVNIVLKQKTSKIMGKVVDANGNGVANVWINGWIRDGQGWGDGRTDAQGNFMMWVAAGEWEIQVDTHRGSEGSGGTNYVPADNRPVTVSIAKNQTVTGIQLKVAIADATINVKAVDSQGEAITEMWSWAFCRKKNMGWGPGNEFGSNIDRGVANIPLMGGFTYICGMHMPPEGERSLQKEVEVTVAVGQVKDVKLVLVENDSKIKGWIKDQHGKVITGMGNGGEVFAVEVGNWNWKPGKLQDDGSYEIGLLGGTGKSYMVGVHFWGAEKGESEFLETHPEPESAISVPADTEVIKIVTVFRADTYISGTVYAPDGTPMPHVWIGADNFQEHEGKLQGDFEGGKVMHTGTETRGDGTFRLSLISDTWMIHSGMPPEFQNDYMSPKEVQVTVTADSPRTGLKLYYRQADAFVNTTATFADGSSPEYGWCWAWSEQGGHSGKDAMGGTARVPLTEGTWWVGCDTFIPDSNKFYRSEEKQITVVKDDVKSMSFTLTEAIFEIPEPFSQTFTATQQNNFTLPNGDSVMLPANAAGNDESTYTFTATPSTNLYYTDDSKPIMYAWNFEITKQGDNGVEIIEELNSNSTICMGVPAEVISETGIGVEDLFAKYYDAQSGTWKLPESAVITANDDGSATACLQVSHFTEFAMTTGATFGAAAGGPAYVVATPASGGGPQVTIWNSEGEAQLNFFAYASTLRIGIQSMAGDVDGDGVNEIIVAPGAGAGPQIRVFSLTGDLESQFFAFGTHLRTGYNLAVADVDGDGVDDIIVTTMAGAGPQIRVFDGSGNVIAQFFAYGTEFRGGVNLTTGDVDGDGVQEIITVPRENSAPHVRVFDYDGTEVASFFAYASTIRGSFHLTTGDVNADGTADIIVTPGPGLGPQVAMFTGSGELINRFFAYATTFRGGIHASVGDVDGDGENEIVASPESGAGPHIRVFSTSGDVESSFFAYAQNLRGSFSSLVADVDGDGTADIVTAPGAGMGPHVRAFNSVGEPVAQYFTHHTGFRGGLNISSVPVF